jgi:F-box-like
MDSDNHQKFTDRGLLPHLPPVYRLPRDILEHIFALNATDPQVWVVDRAAVTLAASQVCTKWRSTALSYPMIWGNTIIYHQHSLGWIDVLLRRSEPSLLDFGSHVGCIAMTDRLDGELGVLGLVFRHTSRLRTFNLQAKLAAWPLICSHFLEQPAPNLEYLNFCVLSTPGCILEKPLFNDHAPSLRNLHLRRCAVNFTSPILMRLTELYVDEITALNAARTPTSWLQVLAQMTSLRWLTIIDAISHSDSSEINLPAVHLPKLEMLRVSGPLHETVMLIDHLVVPPRSGLRLICNHSQVGVDQRLLCKIIERKLGFWEKDTPDRDFKVILDSHSFVFGNLTHVDTTWEVSAAEIEHYKQILPPDPVFSLILQSENTGDILPLFFLLFPLFKHSFPTTTHLVLWLDYDRDDGTEAFRPLVNTFPSFVNLVSLDLLGDSLSYLFPLLQHLLPSGSVFFPALETLHFLEAYFRLGSKSLDHAAAYLQWRRERGFPVKLVHIDESTIDRGLITMKFGDVEIDLDRGNDSGHSDGWDRSDDSDDSDGGE